MERQQDGLTELRRQVGRQVRQLVIGTCLLSLLVIGTPTRGRAAEPASAPQNAGQGAPQPNQERFLQNFISQSLGQGSSAPAAPAAPPAVNPQPAVPGPQSSALSPQSSTPSSSPQPIGDLTAAALKMVLSLGGILGLLVLGGYVIRRYLLNQTFLGKRTSLVRVLARVNITPKAGVALLEVPGKVLVIGITGTTLVALGEVESVATPPLEHATPALPPSFAATLDNSTGSLPEETKPTDVLRKISEAIQERVNRLKPEEAKPTDILLKISETVQEKVSRLKQL